MTPTVKVWSGSLDAALPEADAVGKAVLVTGAGEKVEEKVRVIGRRTTATPWGRS